MGQFYCCSRGGGGGKELYSGFYRFLDPKVKTFSRLLPKTILYFSRLKVNKKVSNRDLEKHKNQAFFMLHLKHMVTTVQ